MRSDVLNKLAYGVSLLGMVMAGPALAADEEQPAEAEVTGGDIVVTAQRREELQRDVPMSITALGQETLTKAGITNTTDIGRVAPGVALPFYGAFILPSIRGISSNGSGIGDNPNVAIYLDGVYQASHSGLNLDLPDVKSIQVLKGPQGTLYGQNAAGGAIIIDTVAPSFTSSGRVTASYGNFDDKSVTGYVTGPLSETVAAQFAGSYRDRQGVNKDLVRGGHDNGLRAHSIRGKLLWEPSDTVSVKLQGFYASHKDTGVYSNGAIDGNSTGVALSQLPCEFGGFACLNLPVADKPHTFAMNIEPDSQTETFGFNGQLNIDVPGVGTIQTVTAYNDSKAFHFNDSDGSPINIVDFYLHISEHDFIQEINFSSEKFGAVTINAGVFYLNKTESYDPYYADIGVAPYSVFPDGFSPGSFVFGSMSTYKKKSYAGYVEANIDITDELMLTAGGRYSYEKAIAYESPIFGPIPAAPPFPEPRVDPRGSFTFDKFTPRIVLRYKPDEDNTVYASYSQGFKSGYIDTSNINNNGCFVAECINPPVKPETVTAYEIGYKGRIAGVLDLNLAAFHYLYEDIQIFSFSPPNNSYYQNAASAKINGFEFGLSARAAEGLTLSLNGAYLDAKYKSFPEAIVFVPNGFGNSQSVIDASGNPLMRTPKWSINGSLDYQADTDAGTFGIFVSPSYNSGMTFDVGNRVRQGEYALLDAELSFEPSALQGLRIVAWGKNLTDHDYLQSVLQTELGDGGSYGDPRTYGVRLEYRF